VIAAVTAALAFLRTRLGAWAAAVAAVVAALAYAFMAGRGAAARAERERREEEARRQREIRHEIDRDVARLDDPADELRRDWRRGL
jgi:Flp pilus assembly protein TadB